MFKKKKKKGDTLSCFSGTEALRLVAIHLCLERSDMFDCHLNYFRFLYASLTLQT